MSPRPLFALYRSVQISSSSAGDLENLLVNDLSGHICGHGPHSKSINGFGLMCPSRHTIALGLLHSRRTPYPVNVLFQTRNSHPLHHRKCTSRYFAYTIQTSNSEHRSYGRRLYHWLNGQHAHLSTLPPPPAPLPRPDCDGDLKVCACVQVAQA